MLWFSTRKGTETVSTSPWLNEWINSLGTPSVSYLFIISLFGCRTGHVKTKCSEHRTLGRWVSTQRQMYKRYFNGQFKGRIEEEIEKEKTKMKQRIDMLEKLDFIWNFSSSFSEDDDGSGTDKSHE